MNEKTYRKLAYAKSLLYMLDIPIKGEDFFDYDKIYDAFAKTLSLSKDFEDARTLCVYFDYVANNYNKIYKCIAKHYEEFCSLGIDKNLFKKDKDQCDIFITNVSENKDYLISCDCCENYFYAAHRFGGHVIEVDDETFKVKTSYKKIKIYCDGNLILKAKLHDFFDDTEIEVVKNKTTLGFDFDDWAFDVYRKDYYDSTSKECLDYDNKSIAAAFWDLLYEDSKDYKSIGNIGFFDDVTDEEQCIIILMIIGSAEMFKKQMKNIKGTRNVILINALHH